MKAALVRAIESSAPCSDAAIALMASAGVFMETQPSGVCGVHMDSTVQVRPLVLFRSAAWSCCPYRVLRC
jgi:hypothetical protein